jgi:hypothetical protein
MAQEFANCTAFLSRGIEVACSFASHRGMNEPMNNHDVVESRSQTPLPVEQEVTELSLLLSRDQALAVMEAARRQGVTVAQFIRRLVSRALANIALPHPSTN